MEALLLSILITAAMAGSVPTLRSRAGRFHLSGATIAIAGITLATSALGNTNPDVLDALGRDRDLLLQGEVWRLVTPLFVQDGGWSGTIFNIVSLLLLGTATESILGWRTLVSVYFSAGIVSEFFAYTLLQHQGFAGNSVAVMGLAGLLAATCLCAQPIPARLIGAIGLLAGLALVFTANLHGVGFAVGAIVGFVLAGAIPLRSTTSAATSDGGIR